MNLINRDIYSRCLTHHAAVRDLDFVVSNSIPIPYFGNVAAFLDSPLRVLTAALNPSDREFPASGPRFDVPKGLRGPVELEEELGMYFRRNPYRGWFGSFEPVLNGLDASYGDMMSDGKYLVITAAGCFGGRRENLGRLVSFAGSGVPDNHRYGEGLSFGIRVGPE
jgi:hypothetical protein